MKGFCFCLFILFGGIQIGTARIIHIPAEYSTIQEGIDASEPGDTILVAEGTYYENINFRGKPLTVASLFLLDADPGHITATCINGSRPTDPERASVVTFNSGEDSTSVLCGFTLKAGLGTTGQKFFRDSVLKETSYTVGGGVFMLHSGGKIIHNLIMENHLISHNTDRGSMGAGIMAIVCCGSILVIRNNLVCNNSIGKSQGWGGGIALLGGRIIAEHNVIRDNTIDAGMASVGAGLFYQNDSTEGGIREVTIRNNVVSGNRALSEVDLGFGGGMALGYKDGSGIVRVHHNLICKNRVLGTGGGIYCYSSSARISENLIFDNESSMYGRSLAVEGEPGLTLDNNRIWNGPVWIINHGNVNTLRLAEAYSRESGTFPGAKREGVTEQFSVEPTTGGILIGEQTGMISFRPLYVPLNAFTPPLAIVDFRQEDNLAGNGKKRQIDLDLRQNSLNIKFGVLEIPHISIYHYSSDEHRFRYYMQGADKDTMETGMDMTAHYQGLKAGKYQFWVTRSEPGGEWNPKGINFQVRVHPPAYRSWIALTAYLLFLLGSALGISGFRTRRLKKETRILEMEVARQTRALQEKNQQVVEMERLRTRFFTDVSHEIRTPLSLITGPLEQLTRQNYSDSRIGNWLSLIKQNSQRLLLMVNQLLDISCLDAGYMKLVLGRDDVIRNTRMLVRAFQPLADCKGIKFVIDIPDSAWLDYYDRDKVEKVISNLLSNAFRFTPRSGIVTCRVKLQSKNCELRIIVADTGPGVPAKDRERIFDRFVRGSRATGEALGGTGIGLSLTRELVQIMHGSIWLKSLVGRGSVFLVSIPLGKEQLGKDEYILNRDEPPLSFQAGKKKASGPVKESEGLASPAGTEVMLVEDNVELRTFIVESLSAEFTMIEAGDGEEGLELVQSRIPDVVISDVLMPGMNGLELCSRIKNDIHTSHIPVILLTARTSSQDKMDGYSQGADDYIFKPFSSNELRVRIRNLLDQRERLKSKYSGMVGMEWGEINVTTLDEKFLKKVMKVITENMLNPEFNVNRLQDLTSISREHLYRKLVAITGESPSSLIRKMRIKTAASILREGKRSITEVSLSVGFSNPSHFARSFKEEYGITPLRYQKETES